MRATVNTTRVLGLAGIVGGAAQLALELSVGDWGTPGTLVYSVYELTNRLMAVALLLMAACFVGLYRAQRAQAGRLGGLGFGMVCVGWAIMSLGNILEFWVFTNQPYPASWAEMNGRAWSWITVLLGMLVMLIGAALWGWAVRRTRALPAWAAVALLALLPVEVTLFFMAYLLLPATAALSIVIGLWLVFRSTLSAATFAAT